VSKKKKNVKNAGPYLQRTLEDERVHQHVADAAAALRKAYLRASRQGGAKAVEDKQLYEQVRRSAASLRAALGAVRQPPPEPKRRGRKVVLVMVLATAGGLAAKRASSGRAEPRNTSDRSPQPVEPGRPAQTGEATATVA
jgi:hypothetical protein